MGHKAEITSNFGHFKLTGGKPDKVRNKYVPKSWKTRPRTVESTTIISYFLIVKFYIPVMTSLLLLILVLILSMSPFFSTSPFMAVILTFGRNILY